MRVLHLESSPNFGGQELRILEELEWLNSHGHQAWIGARPGSKILEGAKLRQLPSLEVNVRSSIHPLTTLKLLKFIRDNQIDLVNTHSSKDAWHGLWLRIFGIPIVRTRHVIQPIKPGIFHKVVWTRGCDRIVATAQAIRRQLLEKGCGTEEKIAVVGEWTDLARIQPRDPSTALLQEWSATTGRTAAQIGMFRSDKGQRHFVEAAILLCKKFPDARFVLAGGDIGSGNLRRELQQRVRDQNLENRFFFYGYRMDVPDIMSSVGCIVIASTGTEGQSRIAPQAFALKRPVVATTVGGLPELVRNGETGLLVPPGNPEALANAIEIIWEDPYATGERIERAYQLALSELSFDQKMEETLQVYDQVLHKSGRAPNILEIRTRKEKRGVQGSTQ